LGAHPHIFCSHLKTRFKQKFRPTYALNACFLQNTVKIASALFQG